MIANLLPFLFMGAFLALCSFLIRRKSRAMAIERAEGRHSIFGTLRFVMGMILLLALGVLLLVFIGTITTWPNKSPEHNLLTR
jgi:purine-cytosine permease-like protein